MNVDRKPRVRPRLRRFAIGALIVLTPIAAWTVWDYVEARRLARVVDRIRANGEPVAAVVQAAPGRRGAASRYYEAAAALLNDEGLYESSGLLRRIDFPDPQTASTLTADMRAWLERNSEAEQLLTKAVALDEHEPLGPFTRNLERFLRVATLADLRTLERLDARDAEGAAEAAIRQLKVARVLQSPVNDLTTITSWQPIGRAINALPRLLELGPTDQALRKLRAAIAFADRDNVLAELVTAERAFHLGHYWDPDKRWFTSREAPMVLGRRIAEPLWFLMRPYISRLVVRQIDLMTEFVETSKKPWPARLDVAFADVPQEPAVSSSRFYYVTLAHSRWATINAQRSRTRRVGAVLAAVRAATAAIAIETYRRAHGAIPASLDQLLPAQLSAVPVDPFSGHPLVYRVVPDGYVIYSLGTNRKDDGGAGAGTPLRRRWGANQAAEDPADIGLRVQARSGDSTSKR